jgi:hypothetical protein
MSKKIKIITSVIVFILIFLVIVGGYFFWQRKKESEVGFAMFEDFKERVNNEEKIIEHKKSGLSVKIPKDWKMGNGVGDLSIIFVSPDFKIYPKAGPYSPPIPEKGCSIEMSVKKEIESSNFDIESSYLKEKIEECLTSTKCEDKEDEVIEVSGHKALKHIFSPENQTIFSGNYVSVKVPRNEWVYTFEAYLFSQDKERCAQEFNKFLEKVSIK